jgi:pimeloyl-ACP methyl ester carboxylesterase
VTDAKGIPGFDERFAEAKACRVRYYLGGPDSADALVLVHGLGGAASNWIELAPALARRHRVLVPELPGHGGSSPLPAVPNLDVIADRIAIVAEREAVFPAVVVGHSLGGAIALRLAILRPEGVSGVVLAGSAGISSATRRANFALRVLALVRPGRYLAPHRSRIARSPLLRQLAFGRWGAADPQMLSDEAVKGLLAGPQLHTDTASTARALVLHDPRQDLERVRCPCLILWGARDSQLPLEDAFDYARRLRAPLRVIADCAHLLIAERPDVCLEAIETFVSGVG